MAFMKRDVNLGLLLLIIVTIVLFSAFSVYYQTTFKDVSLEYQQKLDQLGQVTQELSSKRLELNETYSQRVRAEQDKEELDERYNEARGENEQLTSDNSNLRSEIGSTKSQLAEKSAELDVTEIFLAKREAEIASAKSRIVSLKSDLDAVCDDYETATSTVHDEC